MAAFFWMFVEGIYLYLLVVKVYNIMIENKMHIYQMMSWGAFLNNRLLQCLFWYTLQNHFLIICFYGRFSRCHCRHVAEYCCGKRWNPEFCRWWIVSTLLTFSFLLSSFAAFLHGLRACFIYHFWILSIFFLLFLLYLQLLDVFE